MTGTGRPGAPPGPGLRLLRAGSGRSTLVVLPHAGGNTGHYRDLVASLPAEVTVLGACYPGRLDRLAHPVRTSVAELATEVADELTATLSTPHRGGWPGPVALFGHSMGSYVAVEVAALLASRSTPVSLVVASGSRPPHRVRPRHVVMGGAAAVMADAVRLDPACAPVFDDPELRELVLPALCADYAAVETYRRAVAPQTGCPVVSYAGEDDVVAPPDEVARWVDCASSSAAHAARSSHRTFPGGHFFTRTCADVSVDLGRRLLALA